MNREYREHNSTDAFFIVGMSVAVTVSAAAAVAALKLYYV